MKTSRYTFLLGMALVGSIVWVSSSGAAVPPPSNKPQLITFTPNKIFTPDGFDDNDNSQVIIHGEFPNTCYKVGPVEAVVDETTKKVRITNKAFYYPGCWCLDVLVPFVQVVNLGILDTGKYEVEFARTDGSYHLMSTLPVAKSANPGPDDFTYAPVDEAFVKNETGPGKKTLVLRGTFKTTCMSMKQIPKVLSRPGNLLVVLPVVDVATESCEPARIPFETSIDLIDPPPGETLIHIRALSGDSVNKFVSFSNY